MEPHPDLERHLRRFLHGTLHTQIERLPEGMPWVGTVNGEKINIPHDQAGFTLAYVMLTLNHGTTSKA